MQPIPTLLALLICDQVIVDAVTGKKNIIGVFDKVMSLQFPVQQQLSVYMRLSGAEGNYDLKMRFVDLKDESVQVELQIGVAIPGQLDVADFGTSFPIPLNAPGHYELQILANDIYLGRARLRAEIFTPPERNAS